MCLVNQHDRNRMQPEQPFSLPTDPPKREVMLCVRLTEQEHIAINDFANTVNVSVSRLVRHFVLQAIQRHQSMASGTGEIDEA
jgi:hypothetical protein